MDLKEERGRDDRRSPAPIGISHRLSLRKGLKTKVKNVRKRARLSGRRGQRHSGFAEGNPRTMGKRQAGWGGGEGKKDFEKTNCRCSVKAQGRALAVEERCLLKGDETETEEKRHNQKKAGRQSRTG